MSYVNELECNWHLYEDNVVKRVWKLYENTYTFFGFDYCDFRQEAYIILKHELPKYKPTESGIYTFATNVLKRRMLDYIRNNCKTNKTKANFGAQSLNAPVGDDPDTEYGDFLIDDTRQSPYNDPQKIKRFMKKLSNKQKEILLLNFIGLSEEESIYVLDITQKEYAENIKKMKQPRLCNILRYERNEVV